VASEPPAAAGVVPGEGASGRGHLAAGAAVAETTPALSRVPRSTVPRGAARRAPTQLSLHDAEAAGVAHRRDEVGAGQVRSHRRGDDGVFNPQQVAEIRFHEHLAVSILPGLTGTITSSAVELDQPVAAHLVLRPALTDPAVEQVAADRAVVGE